MYRWTGLAEFGRAGTTVGVAWDARNGMLLMGIDSARPLDGLFLDGVSPSFVVGAGLFPALSGRGGCRVRWNLGQLPFHRELPPGFLAWKDALRQVKAFLSAVSVQGEKVRAERKHQRAVQSDALLTACVRLEGQGGLDPVEGAGDVAACPVPLP